MCDMSKLQKNLHTLAKSDLNYGHVSCCFCFVLVTFFCGVTILNLYLQCVNSLACLWHSTYLFSAVCKLNFFSILTQTWKNVCMDHNFRCTPVLSPNSTSLLLYVAMPNSCLPVKTCFVYPRVRLLVQKLFKGGKICNENPHRPSSL